MASIMIMQIIRNGKAFMFDSCDWAIATSRKWTHDYRGSQIHKRKGQKSVFIHREIMNVSDPNIQVDHINRRPWDNRRCNLRLCSAKENSRNAIGYGRSKYKGVTFKTSTWTRKDGTVLSKEFIYARVMADGKMHWLGTFETEEAAALAYNEAAKIHFGAFAYLNVL